MVQAYIIRDELHRIIAYYDVIEPMLIDLFRMLKEGKIVYYKKEVFDG